jgi:hypothetical protein
MDTKNLNTKVENTTDNELNISCKSRVNINYQLDDHKAMRLEKEIILLQLQLLEVKKKSLIFDNQKKNSRINCIYF